MSATLSFDAFRDNVVDNRAFQDACQRYAHGNGSSEAVAMAVLTAAGFPDLHVDAIRYRWMRHHGIITPEQDILTGEAADLAVDAAMTWDRAGTAGAA